MECEEAASQIVGIVDTVLGVDDMPIRFYTSGDGGELVTSIPIPLAGNQADFRVVYSVEIPDIVAGDLLIASLDFEVTEQASYNVAVVNYLTLADQIDDVTGIDVSDRSGDNVTNNRHHGYYARTGVYLATADLGTKRVNAVVYAAASRASGATLKVEQSYGRLNVVRFSGVVAG